MADWSTIASLATAGGTLVLAIATFASVRSANRASRTGERALAIGVRPVLVQSRDTDPAEPVMWADRHWATVTGGHDVVELVDGNIYLTMLLRNVGSGIAVIQGWSPSAEALNSADPPTELDGFRPQSRDLYVPPHDSSFWQGTMHDPDDHAYAGLTSVIAARDMLTIDLLYSDHEGGQRTVTRFMLIAPDDDSADWVCSVNRHWNLDRDDPRDNR